MFSPLLLSPFFSLSLSLALALFHHVFFFSILYFSFLSRLFPLALGACVYVPIHTYIRREVSLAGTRYIYEEPLPLMVSMRSDATRTCPARSACARTHACVCVCVCGAIPHARVRVDVHTRARPDPATRDTERREDEGGFTHTHAHGAARA